MPLMATNDFRNDGFSPDSFYPPIDKPHSGPLIFNTNPSSYSTHLDEYTTTTTPTPTTNKPPPHTRPTRQKSTQPTPKHSPSESKRSSTSAAATQSQGQTSRHRRERERALADIPTETLIQLVINEELEAKETRQALSTTLSQLEASTRKVEQTEARGRVLEEEREAQALKITQAILDAQREAAKAKEDVAVYQLKLAHAEQEIQRAKEVVHAVENERDEAERAAVKARKVARELKERTVVQLAREEGRRAGFEEGIRQGRLLATVEIVEQAKPIPPRLLGDGTAFIEEAVTEEQGRSPDSETHQPPHSRRKNGGRSARATPRTKRQSLDTSMTTSRSRSSAPTSPASTDAESALRAMEGEKVQMQLRMLERDLEHEREKAAQIERERDKERQREAERLRELEREKDRVREREQARLRELEAEREREREAAARERERERRLREKERESEERARANELKVIERQKRELEREREEREREKERLKEVERTLQRERERDKELDRERERELERERLRLRALALSVEEQDSDGDGPQTPRAAPSNQLQYLAMPQPPVIPVNMPATDTPMPVPMPFPSVSGPARHYPVQQQRTSSSGSSSQGHRNPHRRRASDSGSSSSSMTQFDILTFPNPREERERERKLSVIPEVASSRGDSPNTNLSMDADEPTWVRNPPIDHTKVGYGGGGGVDGWRSGVAGGSHRQPAYQQPDESRGRGQFDQTLLTPASNLTRRSSSSSSAYDITVEPPSPEVNRPSSRASFHEPEISQNHNFLSPNHRPTPLPMSSGRQTRQSDIPTAPSSPVLDAHTLPPGFVPLAFTSPGPSPAGGGGSNIYGPSRPSSTAPPGPKSSSLYANPTTRESADEGQFVAPPPPGYSFTPRSTQNFLPDAPSSASSRGPSGSGMTMTPRAGTNGLPGGSGIYGRPNAEGAYETPRREGNGALPDRGGGGGGVYGRPSEGQTGGAYSSSTAKSYIAHMPDPVIPSAETFRGTPRQRTVLPGMTPRAGNNALPGGSGSGSGSGGIYGRPSEGQTYDGSATPRSTFPGGLTPLSGTQGLPGNFEGGGMTPRSSASQGLPAGSGGIYGRPNEGVSSATPRQGNGNMSGLPPVNGIYGRPTTDPSATPRQGMTPLLGSGFPEASVPPGFGNSDDAGWGNGNGDDDGFDAATNQNTFLNSGVGSSLENNKPAAGGGKERKKKGKKR